MRKWMAIALCACLFCLMACGSADEAKPSAPTTQSSTESVTTTTTADIQAADSTTISAKEETDVATDPTTTVTSKEDEETTSTTQATGGKETTSSRKCKSTTTKDKTTTTEETTVTTTTTTTAAGNPLEVFDVAKKTLVGKEGENNWIYQLGDDGIIVHEAVIDAGLGGEPIEIVQITDTHIGWDVKLRQKWMKMLRYAGLYDCIVTTGDMIGSTWRELLSYFKLSLSPYPNVMACLGNHELFGKIDGIPDDFTERCAVIQEYWPNDVLYSSKVIENKVMLIQLDNSQNKFHDSQVAKFEKDLQTARAKGYAVLVFYHVPLCTENPDEKKVEAILPKDPAVNNKYNFYSSQLRGSDKYATGKIHNLITSNGDVIKGTFCGHFHEDIYTEIMAQTPDGQSVKIPQYVGHAANLDNGHVRKITVK